MNEPTPQSSPSAQSSFAAFYVYYLGEHQNRICRALHFIGSSVALIIALAAVTTQRYEWIVFAIVQGYAWAWAGHYFFEHNKPATFRHPWRSFLADWRMWWHILTGKIPL